MIEHLSAQGIEDVVADESGRRLLDELGQPSDESHPHQGTTDYPDTSQIASSDEPVDRKPD